MAGANWRRARACAPSSLRSLSCGVRHSGSDTLWRGCEMVWDPEGLTPLRQAGALHVAFELAAHGGVDAHAQGDRAALLALLVEHLGVVVQPAQQAPLGGRDLQRQDLVAL